MSVKEIEERNAAIDPSTINYGTPMTPENQEAKVQKKKKKTSTKDKVHLIEQRNAQIDPKTINYGEQLSPDS